MPIKSCKDIDEDSNREDIFVPEENTSNFNEKTSDVMSRKRQMRMSSSKRMAGGVSTYDKIQKEFKLISTNVAKADEDMESEVNKSLQQNTNQTASNRKNSVPEIVPKNPAKSSLCKIL